MTARLIIRDAELDGRRVDVLCAGRVIEAVEPTATRPVADADEVIDARGGAVLPGLHDHHIHLLAAAAALRSVQAGQPADLCILDRPLAEQLADPDATGVLATVIRGAVVYHR